MERKLAVEAQLDIARWHRLEVYERREGLTGEPVVLSVTDLDSGIRYRFGEEGESADQPRTEIICWRGTVRECTVTFAERGTHTVLVVETDTAASAAARGALDSADAAAHAAKIEADRWGGSDRPLPSDIERFW